MTAITYPGLHPSFRMDFFDVGEQKTLRRLQELFHLTWFGEVVAGNSKYRYALLKPSTGISGIMHSEREMMLVFSDYAEFQPRTLDAFDRILNSVEDEFRIEKVVRILASRDPFVAKKIKALLESKPDAPIIVPYFLDEIGSKTTDSEFLNRVREFTFTRDLFSMSSPLRGDLYFYGRANLINEISAKLSSGENFGLFGLRRSGKTSIVNGLERSLPARDIATISIDCQSPSVSQRRWNELLYFIVNKAKEENGLSANLRGESKYTPLDAADSFFKDMTTLRKRSGKRMFVLLFDEVERISPNTASVEHWQNGGDYLSFWQSLRSGFQRPDSAFTYFIVGTNPSAIEAPKINDVDNPLFGNLEQRYIPMFDEETVTLMVRDLGRIMGVNFKNDALQRLHEEFGGHPFLTRHAASYISNVEKTRPIEIDRTLYAKGSANFSSDATTYVNSVVELIEEHYPDEFEMLKYLSQEKYDDFNALAASDQNLVAHLIGYGIVEKGHTGYFFKIGAVQRYFENLAKPAELITREGRLAEISARRNALEFKIRDLVRTVFSIAFHPNERRMKLLSKVQEPRRGVFENYSFEALLNDETCPLYFNELTGIILSYWENFSNVLQLSREDFIHHTKIINTFRVDAHAKDIPEEKFLAARVSLSALESSSPLSRT